MVDFAEGAPCWADVTVPDLEEGKAFYGQLFGWLFQDGGQAYGGYSQAFAGGAPVAALAPQMAGQELPPAWTLYFASPDIRVTAGRVRDSGGEVLLDPMEVGEYGAMLLARDPGGVVFGAWQEGEHRGFGRLGEPGTYCWSEIVTRDPAAADAFFPRVFPFRTLRLEDASGGESMDYAVWQLGDTPVAGRAVLPQDAPAERVPHAEVYFGVGDCDAAVATVRGLGGQVLGGPVDSPYGRMAAVTDPHGLAFSVIDTAAATGEMPATVPA